MSGPLCTAKLKCYQGVDFSETYLFFDPPASGSTDVQNLVPRDFTGCTARMMVRLLQDPSSTQILSLTSSPAAGLTFVSQTFTPGPPQPSVNNGITIAITRTQSLTMNGGVAVVGCYYDLLIDLPGGTTILALSGQFDLVATATR